MSEKEQRRPGSILLLLALLIALPIVGYFAYPIWNPPSVDEARSTGDETPAAEDSPNEPRRSLTPPPGHLGQDLERDAGAAPAVDPAKISDPTPEELAKLPRLEPMKPSVGGMPMGTEAPSYEVGVAFVAGPGVVKGVVRYGGPPIEPVKLDMSKDPKCVSENPDAQWLEVKVHDGKVEGVLVDVVESGIWSNRFPIKPEEVVIDQRGCLYEPRMVALQAGQTLVIRNSDPMLHNVHGLAKRGEFNQAMPKQAQEIRRTFGRSTGFFELLCDIHPWMKATVATVNHPYFALTAADGSYRLEGLPLGHYALQFYYPGLGDVRREVDIGPTGVVLDVDLPGR